MILIIETHAQLPSGVKDVNVGLNLYLHLYCRSMYMSTKGSDKTVDPETGLSLHCSHTQ